MGNLPAWPLDTVEMLRLHKLKESYTDAQLADTLNIFGSWTWQEGHLADLFAGRVKPTNEEKQYFVRYLLSYYVAYCRS